MSILKGRVLSIDYGIKRVGIALSDPLQIIASPLVTLQNSPNLLAEVVKLAESNEVVEIIIGLPLKEDGTPSEIHHLVLDFIGLLKEKVRIPVITVDERYSSSVAWSKIINSVTRKSKRRDKSLMDMMSAQSILEDYLSQKK
ncbi:MAG: Holliday junction resolvase RuvX [Ignavibacteriaceae bacterium]|nr:Holliday junction resolvase RuvX [Ignavibacteriaceae bacterium]